MNNIYKLVGKKAVDARCAVDLARRLQILNDAVCISHILEEVWIQLFF